MEGTRTTSTSHAVLNLAKGQILVNFLLTIMTFFSRVWLWVSVEEIGVSIVNLRS